MRITEVDLVLEVEAITWTFAGPHRYALVLISQPSLTSRTYLIALTLRLTMVSNTVESPAESDRRNGGLRTCLTVSMLLLAALPHVLCL